MATVRDFDFYCFRSTAATTQQILTLEDTPYSESVSSNRALFCEFTLGWGRQTTASIAGIGKYLACWQFSGVNTLNTGASASGVGVIGTPVGSNHPVVAVDVSGGLPRILWTPYDNTTTYWTIRGTLWVAD